MSTKHRVLITCIAGAICAISAFLSKGDTGAGWFFITAVVAWWSHL